MVWWKIKREKTHMPSVLHCGDRVVALAVLVTAVPVPLALINHNASVKLPRPFHRRGAVYEGSATPHSSIILLSLLPLPFAPSVSRSPPFSLYSAAMTSEYKTSYMSTLPLDVVWKIAKKAALDDLMAKLLPTYITNVAWEHGAGAVGGVRVVTLGEAVGPEGQGQKVKEQLDVVDDATHTIRYKVLEGGDPRYLDTKFTLKFAKAGSGTAVEWLVNYTPVDASVPTPDHYKGMSDAANKAMEAYAKDHAAEFA